MKIEDKKNEEEMKAHIENLRKKPNTNLFLAIKCSEWREKLESVANILHQALPEERIPTVYDWVDEIDNK